REDARAGGRRRPGDVEHVLDRERNAPERPPLGRARRELRLAERLLGADRDERVQAAVERADARERALDRLERRELAGPQRSGEAGDRHSGGSGAGPGAPSGRSSPRLSTAGRNTARNSRTAASSASSGSIP